MSPYSVTLRRHATDNSRAHRWPVYAVQALALSAAMLLICLQWKHSRLLIGNALFYDLSVWGCAAGITLCTYLAVSMADFNDLVRASLSASAPAMWLVPAILFLSARTTGATVVGLLLVANTMRLLISRSAPQEHVPVRQSQARRSHHRMFYSAYLRPAPFREKFAAVAGAIALQAGVWAISAGYPLTAAVLFGVCATIWTLSSKFRGALQPAEETGLTRSLLSILVTLLLTIALSLGYFKTDKDTPADAGILEPTRQVISRLTHTPKPKLQAAKKSTPVFTPARAVGTSVPGVILRPDFSEAKPQRRVWGGPPFPALSLSPSHPLTIPFSGEYHLFRTSSGSLPADSIIDHGTPLETHYATTNGEPMQMEAYQALSPPIDVRNCGQIQMTLSNGETLPGIVLIQFLTAKGIEEVGIAVFALNGASEETVNFTIPTKLVNFEVSAIRVIFQHNPMHCERNSRIAIQRFTLAPRI